MAIMCTIGTSEVDDNESRMNTHLMICKLNCSLDEKCKRFCKDKKIINDVKGYGKFKKKASNTKVKTITVYN